MDTILGILTITAECAHLQLSMTVVQYRISIGYLCVPELTTRSPSSVTKPSNCKNRRILLVYSRHIDSRVFWGHLRQTYCQHSHHRQTLLLVGSHAAPPPFVTVFFVTASFVRTADSFTTLRSQLKLICLQNICSRSAIRICDTLTRSFVRYKFVTYLLT